MLKKSLILLTAVTASLLLPGSARPQSPDPSSFSVEIKDFSENIYSENISEYLLHSDDDAFEPASTPFQKIEKQYEGTGKTVILRTGDFTGNEAPLKNAELCLRDTRFLNLSSPEVRELSRRFNLKKNTVHEIEKFVHDYIDRKTLGIPLVPAVNIIRNRSGDCTEHSVLAIALLRSLKIPARAVMGMILVPEFQGRRNVFVYHMWAEAFYRGRWHLVDATRPDEKHPNRYIAFAYHSLTSEMPLSYFRVIAAIQNLEVRYLKQK